MGNFFSEVSELGECLLIADSAKITCKKLVIGRNVVIGDRVNISCKNGSVYIGDNVFIGNDVTISLSSFSIGEYSKLHNHCLINGKDKVEIGDNCWIGQNSVLNGESFLKIGNNVGIGTYSSIWTHGYFGQLIDGCQIFSIKPTVIKDDVWLIGSYNTIFPGVTIGEKAIVMGTSVVTKSILPNKIYGGNPAKDLTDKLGNPYIEINYSKKVKLILDTILDYLKKNDLNYKSNVFGLEIEHYGNVIFYKDQDLHKTDIDTVVFYENVYDWSINPKESKFCLKTKLYQKKYSKVEILVKTILNPVVARFVKKNKI